MDAEQYKEFEQKLKLADEYDHPLPNEKAWNAMSAKLDDAFNKEKKKRRIWFFILPLIAMLAPAIFFLSKDKSGESKKIIAVKNNNGSMPPIAPDKTFKKNAPFISKTTSTEILKNKEPNEPSLYAVSIGAGAYSIGHKKANSFPNNYISKSNSSGADKNTAFVPGSDSKELNAGQTILDKISGNEVASHRVDIIQKESISTETDTSLKSKLVEPNPVSEEESDKPKRGTKKLLRSRFYLSASLGQNKSFVSSGSGKSTTTYGGGIGYQIKKRWFIESGVYAGRSIYNAGPEDYNWEGTYGYKLKTVAADCFIIEIPITLGYTFYEKRRLLLFGTAGMSSQLMKRENYDYTATRYSLEYKGTWTYKNENQHFISAAQVGLGVGYKVANKLILQVTPYYKKSLKGIGAGEVKLNTAGMRISVQYSPFLK